MLELFCGSSDNRSESAVALSLPWSRREAGPWLRPMFACDAGVQAGGQKKGGISEVAKSYRVRSSTVNAMAMFLLSALGPRRPGLAPSRSLCTGCPTSPVRRPAGRFSGGA